jgi:C1A family cysteine protease
MPKPTKRRYGWRPDLPDARDRLYRVEASPVSSLFPCFRRKPKPPLPPSADLTEGGASPLWPEVFDQGDLGSCVENATVAASAFALALEGVPAVRRVLSRLYLYWYARGGVPTDTGSTIRDAVKAMAAHGDCLEAIWPYEMPWRSEPSAVAKADAEKRRGISYARLSTLTDMKHCLAVEGHPFVFGMSVYESFETDITRARPVCPMPKPHETLLGGHALCAVGYDDSAQCLLVRNSWGPDWAAKGFFWLPYSYASDRNLSDDYWTVRTVPVA